MYTYSQTKSERKSAKERKEHHFIPANSLSHSDSKSSSQRNISAAVKMSQNPSNTAYWTKHTEGAPTDPSTYRQRVEPEDMQADPNSASSSSQSAQTSASNPSHQQGNNNQGSNAAPGGNNPPMEAYLAQTQQQDTYHPAGGFQAPGSTAGTGQGGGHGSGNTGGGRGGYQNGHAGSTSANWGSSGS